MTFSFVLLLLIDAALPLNGTQTQSSPTCYLVEYRDWGTGRIIGSPIGKLPAPAVIVLTWLRPVKDLLLPASTADSFKAAKVLKNAQDTASYPAYWARWPQDSLTVDFPMNPGLYGLHYNLRQYHHTLLGEVRTWTDVYGARQAHSGVLARLTQCPRGA